MTVSRITLLTTGAKLASLSKVHEQAQAGEHERLRRFGDFLKQSRLGIPVDATSLGSFVRLQSRVGKIVSQEELAEAIGVSRCWYGMLESGRPAQPSFALIDRICDALMLDERRRLVLFKLGLPAFSHLLSKTIFSQWSA